MAKYFSYEENQEDHVDQWELTSNALPDHYWSFADKIDVISAGYASVRTDLEERCAT